MFYDAGKAAQISHDMFDSEKRRAKTDDKTVARKPPALQAAFTKNESSRVAFFLSNRRFWGNTFRERLTFLFIVDRITLGRSYVFTDSFGKRLRKSFPKSSRIIGSALDFLFARRYNMQTGSLRF